MIPDFLVFSSLYQQMRMRHKLHICHLVIEIHVPVIMWLLRMIRRQFIYQISIDIMWNNYIGTHIRNKICIVWHHCRDFLSFSYFSNKWWIAQTKPNIYLNKYEYLKTYWHILFFFLKDSLIFFKLYYQVPVDATLQDTLGCVDIPKLDMIVPGATTEPAII